MKPEREWASQRVIAPPEPATPKFEKRHILYEKLRLGTIYGGFGYFGSLKDFAVPGVAGGGIRSHHTLVVDAEEWPTEGAEGACSWAFLPPDDRSVVAPYARGPGAIRSHHTLVVDAEAWPMVSADGAIHARSFRPTTGVSSLLTHADLA